MLRLAICGKPRAGAAAAKEEQLLKEIDRAPGSLIEKQRGDSL